MIILYKKKKAYEMRMSDWSADVCSSERGEPAIGQAALLRQRHELFGIGPKLLRLGDGGRDLLMLDERRRHIAEQCRAMAAGALKFTSADTMAHGHSPVCSGAGQGTPDQAATRTAQRKRHPGQRRNP